LDADKQHYAYALEDLPEDVRQEAAMIAGTQPGLSLRRRILDEVETVGLDSYGALEQVPLLSFLAHYPVTPYTYRLSDLVSRGQRPNADKLADLAKRHRVTINLCAEMPDGDAPAIARAGLDGVLRTHHIPITDMETPSLAQLTEILDLLSGPDAEPTYVHCEAGKGRTGVVVACYRMAVMGWSVADALTEAENFGCCIPDQQAFIREYGEMLAAGSAPGRYPLRPLGSARPTPAELTATIHACTDH
jgi:Tyrosine phosphatase family